MSVWQSRTAIDSAKIINYIINLWLGRHGPFPNVVGHCNSENATRTVACRYELVTKAIACIHIPTHMCLLARDLQLR